MLRGAEVVITGVGVVSPIGIGKDAFWQSLLEQQSGVRRMELFERARLPFVLGAEVQGFDAKQYVTPRKALKVMCREIQIGYSAAALAMRDAGLEPGSVDPDRLGVVLGNDMLYCDVAELVDVYRNCIEGGQFRHDSWGVRAMSDVNPLWMLKHLPNMAACHIGIGYDARGPNNTITLGEASSLLAVIEGSDVIARGWADVMIVGGTGSRLNVTPLVYHGDYYLSHHDGDPARAVRPFDANRDGTVLGEGAAAFVLETREHATARGATVLARVLGFGRAFDTRAGGSLGSAIRNSIAAGLADADLKPEEIGHVNAHGLATPQHDRAEAQAIRAALGNVPVTAPKSFFGNLGSGSGAVEMAASVLALVEGEVPVTLNYESPDPQCPVNVVHGEPLAARHATAVVLSQSGTGQAAALVLAGT